MKINSFIKDNIKFIEVENDNNFKVIFANLSASIFSVQLKGTYLTRNVKNISDFKLLDQYYGKTIGRISNRTKQIFNVKPNEGENILHGGYHSLSSVYFEYKIEKLDDRTVITFETLQKESFDGYPGDLNVVVKYIVLSDKNELDIFYEATSNKDTVVSLTNHTFWTLGSNDLSDLSLRINSHKYLDVNPSDLLPNGIKNVDEVFDFSNEKLITKDIKDKSLHQKRLNGYDHYFYFDNNSGNVLTLRNQKYKLDIETDFEGVQIYTHGFDIKKPIYPECEYLYNSIAIEPSDSFKELHLLNKNEKYERYIKIKIE